MAGTAFKSIDKNRFKKIYPAKRFAPVLAKQSEKNIILENAKLVFNEASGTTSMTYTFEQKFATVPTVTHGVRSQLGDMVLVKITNLTSQSVSVEVSAPFDGSIDLHITEIGS
tara:strand:+ start:5802 stop:6140 length:339 start_codon:yes stop_codon:yes gene_type:complete